MNPVPFSWMIIGLLGIFIASGGGGFWYGYRYADRAAEIHGLNDKLAQANASLAAKEAEARANAAVTSAFAQRAIGDAQTFQSQIQEPVDAIVSHEEAKPAADVCRIGDVSFDRLRDLALRARVPQANATGRP